MLHSLGKITVPSAGTPVRATSGQSDPSTPILCHAVLVEAWPTNTGKAYVGVASMNKTTGSNVLGILPIPTDNSIPTFSATNAAAPNGLNAADIYVDVQTNGEAVLISLLIT